METTTQAQPKIHHGSCQCKAVRFTANIDARNGTRCNCTFCQKLGALSHSTKPAHVALLSPAESLGEYVRGPVASSFFCKNCGVYCFAKGNLPEMGGEFVSINLNCLDDIDPIDVKVMYWDGRHDNWYAGPRETPWPIF